MCDFFSQRMEKDQGDLTDIIRVAGGHMAASDWPLPPDTTSFLPSSSDDFGNPFLNFQDPLLTDFFQDPLSASDANNIISNYEHDIKSNINKPCMLPAPIRPYPNLTGRGGFVPPVMDGGGGGNMHPMLSARTTGMKRRKNQAKKVICIPAPAVTTGGRPTAGEVVPSDRWAWRKYGQKPIKGSPYPRGYYRCSSSKGCSARRQVERSRTDPNMLVITYTSEHNHSWPTQRNALAGSIRSQQVKNNCSSSNKDPENKNQKQQHVPKELNMKIESKSFEDLGDIDKCIDLLRDDEFDEELLMDQYKPMIPESGQPDDFFSDLQELEADPMNLIFTKEYMEAKPDNHEEKGGNKGSSDPFDLLDWGLGGGMK